jgi:predicted glutamine amidotransferase
MCVIIVKKKDKNITRRELKECWDFNPDGAGFMYAANNKLHISKGYFSFRAFYHVFRKYERLYPESDFVIHMRIATSGKKDYDNCHPFIVNDGLAFAHNGIFWGLGDKEHSDTYILNEEILSKFPRNFLDIPEIFKAVTDYVIESHSKLVFMDNQNKITIVNEKAGTWDDGIWYSSGHYMTKIYTPSSYKSSYYNKSATGGHDEYDNEGRSIYKASEVYCFSCNTWIKRDDVQNVHGNWDTCPICGEIMAEDTNDYLWNRK